MSVGKAPELKVSKGYAEAPEVKKFSFYEVNGLIQVMRALDMNNLQRPAKVDYWIAKNVKAINTAFGVYLNQEDALLKSHTETYKNDKLLKKDKTAAVFVVYIGKDDTDLLISDGGTYFKIPADANDPILEPVFQPRWKLEVTPAEEGKEAVFTDMKYEPKYKSVEDKLAFEKALGELQDNFAEPIDLYTMKEDNLEGLNVSWVRTQKQPDGRVAVTEDLTQFRTLLYENFIA